MQSQTLFGKYFYRRLMTVPGVGAVTAAAFLVRKLKSDARHPRGIKFHGLETIQPTRYKGWTRSDGSLIHHPHVARIRGAHRQYIITNGHVALTPYTRSKSGREPPRRRQG
jgi:hypothetical protein